MYGGENMWWSLIDGSVMFHDGPDEPDSSSYPPLLHFRYPPLLHFRSSSNKDLQMLLADYWRKCPGVQSIVTDSAALQDQDI